VNLHTGIFDFGSDHLTANKAQALASGRLKGRLDAMVLDRITASRNITDQMALGDKAVYGVNTGFGPLCSTKIKSSETQALQYNILKSHSVGVGIPISQDLAKLMLILKLHALAQGYSGASSAILKRILWHINQDIIPVVPSQGSVGASGDLAPLAHLFLPLIGLGKVVYKEKIVDTGEMFQKEGIAQVRLQAKDGLALINGTQFIAAHSVSVIDRLHSCLSQADIIGALMIEGLLGSPAPFDGRLHQLRKFPGSCHVAHRISQLLHGSEIVESHKDCDRVQDPYSLRCIPQVHGASRAAWQHLRDMAEIELNAVTDNPVILGAGVAISGGNFHGQPLALPLDYACLAASEIGNISDRRTYLSLIGVAKGVPKLLMQHTGINSAFMMLQYTSAALASENKTLCFPASADSIPTSLGQEDHVSMGSISGRKALQVVENVEKILAIELICAAQSFDYHLPLKSSRYLNEVHDLIRRKITHAEEDRIFSEDINTAISLIRDRSIIECVSSAGPPLQSPYDDLFEKY